MVHGYDTHDVIFFNHYDPMAYDGAASLMSENIKTDIVQLYKLGPDHHTWCIYLYIAHGVSLSYY